MKVKWIEEISVSYAENIYLMYPNANLNDFDKKYSGEVIGSNKSFWGNTYLVVRCDDNIIREVKISKIKVIE